MTAIDFRPSVALVAYCFCLCWASVAIAQDANQQDRLEQYLPLDVPDTKPYTVQQKTVTTYTTETITQSKELSRPEKEELATELRLRAMNVPFDGSRSLFSQALPDPAAKERNRILALPMTELNLEITKHGGSLYRTTKTKVVVPKKKTVDEKKLEAPSLTLSGTPGYNFTSNVFSSPTRGIGDAVFSVQPTLTYKLPLSFNDVLAFSTGPGFTRFHDSHALDFDAYSTKVVFIHTLEGGLIASRVPDRKQYGTNESITVSAATRYLFLPGFESYRAGYYIPQLTWTLDQLPVGPWNCAKTKNDPACVFAKISVSVDRNWISNGIDNWNVTPKIALSWMAQDDVKLGASAGVINRVFEETARGRTDQIMTLGVTVDWTPKKGPLTFSAGYQHLTRFSNRAFAEYDEESGGPSMMASWKF